MNRYLVKPGEKLNLSKWDPNDKGGFKGSKEEGLEEVEKLNARLEELQEVLYAEHRHKVLIVLQAMDTGGSRSCDQKGAATASVCWMRAGIRNT